MISETCPSEHEILQCPTCGKEGSTNCCFPEGRDTPCAECEENGNGRALIGNAGSPGQAEAARLVQLYRDAQNGLRRVVALGLYCFEIKARLKHGQFTPWCEAHVPGVSHRSLKAYMQLTRNILEACGVQMGSALPILNNENFLADDTVDLPPTVRELKEKIFSVIDGKTARQLFLDFKTARENSDGTLSPCTGAGQYHGRGQKPTPIEAVQAQTNDAHKLAEEWCVLTTLFLRGSALTLMDHKVLRRLLDDGISLNNKIRDILRS